MAGTAGESRGPPLRATLVGRDGCARVFWRKGSSAPVLGVVLGVAQWGISVFVYRPCGSIRGSWLPLSHDMGMIGFLCVPMQVGCEAVVVPPEQFLRRPLMWAELITRHRATLTSGPNFAYSDARSRSGAGRPGRH